MTGTCTSCGERVEWVDDRHEEQGLCFCCCDTQYLAERLVEAARLDTCVSGRWGGPDVANYSEDENKYSVSGGFRTPFGVLK